MQKPNTKQQKLNKKQPVAVTKSWSQQVIDFVERNRSLFFIITMIVGGLMSILLFDVKVSLSGDDSDYIIYADEFWRHFTFPGFRGPLYPIILSPFIGIFGMNLIVLKSLSAIFLLLSIWLLYKSFRDIIPAIIHLPALLLTCICAFVFFYASYTYSEPFFMFVQSLFIYFFSKYFMVGAGSDSTNIKMDSDSGLKKNWYKYLIIGVLALCMGLTRSIGYSVIGVVILYFAIHKRWKELAYTLVASLLVFGLFQLLKTMVWPDAGSAYDIKNYLAKDYYNPIEPESWQGLLNRFTVNSVVYLSAFLCQFMGIIPETPSNLVEADNLRTILIYLLFGISLFVVFKRNNALLFIGIYTGVMNFFSFVLLQTIWGQDRLIVIYYPLILIFLLGGIYYLFQIRAIRKLFFVYPLIILVLFQGTLSITTQRIKKNFPVLQENLLGNQLYGLTPDWVNFIKASRWAAQNLEKDAVIVSRKPSISKIYTGGREFSWAPTDITVPFETLTMMQNKENQSVVVVFGVNQNPNVNYIVSLREPIVFEGKTINGAQVCLLPNDGLQEFVQSIQEQNMEYTLDFLSFVERMRNVDNRIYDPDMMLNYLIENDIRYLLLPQLRSDPTRNTGVYINNTHRFIWFISCKYPDLFQGVYLEGNEEPCEIVEFIR